MIFYKAVRPNGTDFRTGTVDYASICGTGESLPELPGGRCCTKLVYHASTSKADTLIGGEWPCRLFEVDGEAVSSEENKRGFRTLTVIRELPAWGALGPNGEAVAALIDRASTLTGEQVDRLNAAWEAADGDARDDAHQAAGDVAWDAARNAAWQATWGATWQAARHAAWEAAWNAAGYAAWDDAHQTAWHTARHAAGALVVRDLITKEQFDILTGPWVSVVGEI